MKIEKDQITTEIKKKLTGLECHLSVRIQNTLELLISEDIQAASSDKIEIVDLMIRLILKADREPASMIANLLTVLDNESVSQLEDWTISNSGAFLRDYFKKDYILDILKSKEQESIQYKNA